MIRKISMPFLAFLFFCIGSTVHADEIIASPNVTNSYRFKLLPQTPFEMENHFWHIKTVCKMSTEEKTVTIHGKCLKETCGLNGQTLQAGAEIDINIVNGQKVAIDSPRHSAARLTNMGKKNILVDCG